MAQKLKPFRIGPLEVAFPVTLAPMAGYTDVAYRLICRRMGADYCTTEMMLDRLTLLPGKLRDRLIKTDPADHPVAGQILGNDPQTMVAAAGVLAGMGFDAIDLNFACPVRKALARRRGGYLMKLPDRVIEITRAVLAATDRPVTLKARRGFLTAEEPDALWRIAEAAFDAGAAALCIHARSVEQKYTGQADWGLLAEAKRRFPARTIIGSGDVLTPSDALRMLDETGVDAAAVARGCLGDPWFFRQVRDLAAGREPYQPPISEQRDLLAGHFAQSCRLYGAERAPRVMRKFGIKYARLHAHPAAVRAAFVAVNTVRHWEDVLKKFYAE